MTRYVIAKNEKEAGSIGPQSFLSFKDHDSAEMALLVGFCLLEEVRNKYAPPYEDHDIYYVFKIEQVEKVTKIR